MTSGWTVHTSDSFSFPFPTEESIPVRLWMGFFPSKARFIWNSVFNEIVHFRKCSSLKSTMAFQRSIFPTTKMTCIHSKRCMLWRLRRINDRTSDRSMHRREMQVINLNQRNMLSGHTETWWNFHWKNVEWNGRLMMAAVNTTVDHSKITKIEPQTALSRHSVLCWWDTIHRAAWDFHIHIWITMIDSENGEWMIAVKDGSWLTVITKLRG